jgi:sugar phosphate isomerase/epimerase
VHDNHGKKDAHLWPGKGTIDWTKTMALLRSAPEVPPLLLEIEGEEKVSPVEGMKETFEKLEGNETAESAKRA